MMFRSVMACSLTLAVAVAQSTSSSTTQTAAAKGSIAGAVMDAGTGAPLPDVQVHLDRSTPSQSMAITDSQGRYSFRDLEAGTHVIRAINDGRQNRGPSEGKIVNLNAGQTLKPVDFLLKAFGEISGRVLDENKEPVPGMTVLLVTTEYVYGVQKRLYASRPATTNDRGEYILTAVEPGIPYFVMAKKSRGKIDAVSAVPADPRLRRKVPMPTYYPDATRIEGAQSVVLSAGERREAVDIRSTLLASYCIEGQLQEAGRPVSLRFAILEEEVSSGVSSRGGLFIAPSGGTSGPDGKIRICDLCAGRYNLTAWHESDDGSGSAVSRWTQPVSVVDGDVRKVTLSAVPGIRVDGEVVLDSKSPDQTIESKPVVRLRALSGALAFGDGPQVRAAIPGGFTFSSVFPGDYFVEVLGVPAGLYVKDITYGGASVLNEPFGLGRVVGNGELRAILADDGGTLRVSVADRDGKPVPYAYVSVMAANIRSEAALASEIISGRADQEGIYSSGSLAPGDYLVLAHNGPVDPIPERIAKLWSLRTKAEKIAISPSARLQVTLKPTVID